MRNFINILNENSNLPMDEESRMKRAKELGFNILAYHGTKANFNEFDLEKGKSTRFSGHAPYFSDSKDEANGYANDRKNGKKSKTLTCLLKINNPFYVKYDDVVSDAFYKKIVGTAYKYPNYRTLDGKIDRKAQRKYRPSSYRILSDLQSMYMSDTPREMWTKIYRRLIQLGYDAIIYPETPPDFSDNYYQKIIVLDPKNIRSINARFDPTKIDSRNLMD